MKNWIILISICLLYLSAKAQDYKKIEMKKYNAIEINAANKVLDIQYKLFNENPDWDSIIVELQNILANVPNDYFNSFSEKGLEYVKFWDESEYNQYVAVEKKRVIWLQNAYPLAYYLLAVIQIERGLFDDAYITLNKGIELEPDNPTLLSELGLLFSSIASVTQDEKHIRTSSSYFEKAFDSRAYNTNSQKARSLRGIGYNLIELNDYDGAKKIYEASLTWEDSKIAKEELKVINDKLSDKSINVSTAGSNLNSGENTYTFKYFTEQENKLPKEIKEKMPNKYVYIWSKASLFLFNGEDNFRKDDYFHYPLTEWDSNQLKSGVTQIVHFLKGIDSNYYISLESLVDIKNLLLTFHFSIVEKKEIRNNKKENILQVKFKHIMDEDTITLFFKLE